MDRYRTGAFTVVLGLALVGGATSAYARANESGGQEIGTIRYINRMQNIVVLTNGEEWTIATPFGELVPTSRSP